MSRPPITFRLNEHECQLIEKEKRDGESINQTAARLLRERLGIREETSETLDKYTIDEIVSEKVNSVFQGFKSIYEDYISEEIEKKVNEKIAKIQPKTTPRKTPAKTPKSETEV